MTPEERAWEVIKKFHVGEAWSFAEAIREATESRDIEWALELLAAFHMGEGFRVPGTLRKNDPTLREFAARVKAAVAAEEREACAKEADYACRCGLAGDPGDEDYQDHVTECRARNEVAAAIRARG